MSARKQILIIDDEDDFRLLLRSRLESEGYIVSEAINGSHAMDLIRNGSYDLIILDLMMPHVSGYQVWSQLHREEDLKNIPLMILTAKYRPQDKFFGDALAPYDYTMKTEDFHKILERIRIKLYGTP